MITHPGNDFWPFITNLCFRLIELSNLHQLSYSKAPIVKMAFNLMNKQGTKSDSNGDHSDQSEFKDIIQMDRSKPRKDWKEKWKNKSLGEITWEQMFEGGIIKLPATSFMNRLKQAITHKKF